MIQVWAAPRVDMGHQVEYAVSLHDQLARSNGNAMTGLDADARVHLDVRVDDDHVAHFAGMHIVNAANPRCFLQRLSLIHI